MHIAKMTICFLRQIRRLSNRITNTANVLLSKKPCKCKQIRSDQIRACVNVLNSFMTEAVII